MSIIRTTGIYKISHFNLFALAKWLKNIIAEFDITITGVQSHVANVELNLNNFDIVLKRDKSNPLTNQIVAADEHRDNAIRSIEQYLKSCIYRRDPIISQAGRTLLEIFARYGGGITNLGYAEESAAIDNIMKDIEAHPNLITVTNVQYLLDELSEAEDDFVDLMRDRGINKEKDGLTLRNTRRPLYKSVLDLIDLINLLAIDGGEPWESIITRTNDYITTVLAAERSPQETPEEEITE